MAKTWKLMKIMVKMQWSLAGKSGTEITGIVIASLLLIPFGIYLLMGINSLIETLYNALAPLGHANLILGLIFTGMFILFFFISIGTVLSSFYFAEDVESFIPLPFKAYQILCGKAAVPFLSLYGINTLVLLPVLLFYGNHSDSGPLYYVYSLILWLLTPLFPFVLAAILIIFIMRFANISKNKDRTKVFLGLLGFIFAIGINVVIRLDSGNRNMDIAKLALQENGLLELITKFMPTAYFSSIALTEPATLTGFLYLLLLVGIGLGSLILFMTMGQTMYFKGVLGLSGGKRSTFKEDNLHQNVKSKSVLGTLFQKEVKTIFRTPTFFTQIVVQSLFFPVFLVIIIILESEGTFSSLGTVLSGSGGKNTLLILFGITIVALGINPASFSSISRDGKSWFNHLYLPISAEKVILSKLLISFSLNLVSLIILVGVAIFMFQLPTLPLILWILLALFLSWVTSVGGLILDLHDPKLNWTDEREVFKGRFIGLLVLLTEAALFGTALLVIWKVPFFNDIWSSAGFLFIYLTAITAGCHLYLKKLIKQRYYQLLG